MQMMDRPERRAQRRLDARYNISYQEVGSTANRRNRGRTANVSSGGLYIESGADQLQPGELLKVELAVPPTSGLLEFGGEMAGFARVLRVDRIGDNAGSRNSPSARYGAALQFCRPLRLCV
jgi:hypothetical protein